MFGLRVSDWEAPLDLRPCMRLLYRRERSTLNVQRSTFNHQPSTGSWERSYGSSLAPTASEIKFEIKFKTRLGRGASCRGAKSTGRPEARPRVRTGTTGALGVLPFPVDGPDDVWFFRPSSVEARLPLMEPGRSVRSTFRWWLGTARSAQHSSRAPPKAGPWESLISSTSTRGETTCPLRISPHLFWACNRSL
jgi:hypothetical protein